MLRRAVVFCAVLGLATAYYNSKPLSPIPEKFKDKTGCYVSDIDMVIPFGKTLYMNKRCFKYVCGENWLETEGCSPSYRDSNCTVSQNKNGRYPSCCVTVNCP